MLEVFHLFVKLTLVNCDKGQVDFGNLKMIGILCDIPEGIGSVKSQQAC